ncbi:hypothetical protein DIRU0_D22166 [Diutina rugosa]
MFVHTPKRPSLPPTTPCAPAPSLPPLSSLIHSSATPKLPPIDQFASYQLRAPRDAGAAVAMAPAPSTSTSSIASTASSVSTSATDSGLSSNATSTPTSAKASPPTQSKRSPPPSDKAWAFISHSPATYPTQEPSIDNAPLARRKRRRTSPNELSILNKEFELGSTPNKQRRQEIAAKVSMTEKAVQIWFQNKRQSLRKHSNQEREVTELPPTPAVMMVPPPPPAMVMAPMMYPAPPPHHPMAMMPMPLVSSTPTKPVMMPRAHSYPTPHTATTSPLIKQRAASIPIPAPTTTSDYDDSNTSLDDSMIQHHPPKLVLSETRKKQPPLLNSDAGATMTFKLASHKSPQTVQQRLADAAEAPKTSDNNQCVEHLLKLKEGQWK